MVVIEYLVLRFEKKIRRYITGNPFTQYLVASALGAIPGCIDAFFVVSLYTAGIVGFGALAAVMISTAGDEAFIMLAMIPDTALIIFGICFVLGIVGGFLADIFVKKFNLKLSKSCCVPVHKKEKVITLKHFVKEHVLGHIVKKHMPKLFLWLFFTLLVINWALANLELQSLLPKNYLWLLVFAAIVGIIPESGPHIMFVVLFSKGLIPFSVLLVNTISQDGHGLLPLLSHSIKDTIYLQVFTTLFALGVGIILFLLGV
ncbi:MAG: arsenic efflux protein [Candidatus Diapherotrites archaeon]|nr:arsenic efflux protein [Candidatus Diapherotrites archaeon]